MLELCADGCMSLQSASDKGFVKAGNTRTKSIVQLKEGVLLIPESSTKEVTETVDKKKKIKKKCVVTYNVMQE